jgi:predicted transcriptional regulator
MIEILTLLARIEYGLDEKEIASSLEISPVVVLANCHALEQEMFVHHNDELAQWFIGQRGIEFLRLNGQSS